MTRAADFAKDGVRAQETAAIVSRVLCGIVLWELFDLVGLGAS